MSDGEKRGESDAKNNLGQANRETFKTNADYQNYQNRYNWDKSQQKKQ